MSTAASAEKPQKPETTSFGARLLKNQEGCYSWKKSLRSKNSDRSSKKQNSSTHSTNTVPTATNTYCKRQGVRTKPKTPNTNKRKSMQTAASLDHRTMKEHPQRERAISDKSTILVLQTIPWLGARVDSPASEVTSLERLKGKGTLGRDAFCETLFGVNVRVLRFSLADEDEQRPVSHATVHYPPLSQGSPYLSALRFWREGERRSVDASDLFQRGADQVVHNAGLYDSRRSSIHDERHELTDEAGPSTRQGEGENQPSPRVGNLPRSTPRQGRQSALPQIQALLNAHPNSVTKLSAAQTAFGSQPRTHFIPEPLTFTAPFLQLVGPPSITRCSTSNHTNNCPTLTVAPTS